MSVLMFILFCNSNQIRLNCSLESLEVLLNFRLFLLSPLYLYSACCHHQYRKQTPPSKPNITVLLESINLLPLNFKRTDSKGQQISAVLPSIDAVRKGVFKSLSSVKIPKFSKLKGSIWHQIVVVTLEMLWNLRRREKLHKTLLYAQDKSSSNNIELLLNTEQLIMRQRPGKTLRKNFKSSIIVLCQLQSNFQL